MVFWSSSPNETVDLAGLDKPAIKISFFLNSHTLGSTLNQASLQMKDNHNVAWDAVNEFKSATASAMSPYELDWQVGPENPQSLQTSCFPQMLPTDDSCWASSKPSWRKESSRFAPDRAYKGFSSGPRKSEEATWRDGTAKRSPLQYNNFSVMWNQPTFMRDFNKDWVVVNACWLQMPTCLTH